MSGLKLFRQNYGSYQPTFKLVRNEKKDRNEPDWKFALGNPMYQHVMRQEYLAAGENGPEARDRYFLFINKPKSCDKPALLLAEIDNMACIFIEKASAISAKNSNILHEVEDLTRLKKM